MKPRTRKVAALLLLVVGRLDEEAGCCRGTFSPATEIFSNKAFLGFHLGGLASYMYVYRHYIRIKLISCR